MSKIDYTKVDIKKEKGVIPADTNVANTPKTHEVNDANDGIADEDLQARINALELDSESAWEKEMKKRIKVDPTDDDILLVNDGMQVDNNGDITIGRDLFVEDEVVIDNLQKIVDTDGHAIIPDPSGNLRYALGHSSTGYAWYKGFELAGFEVVKKSVFEGAGYVYQTHKVYFVWNDTAGADYGTVYIRYYEQ